MLFSIRLAFLSRPPYGDDAIRSASDDFENQVGPKTGLSEAYNLLTDEQRGQLREMIENPAVRMKDADGTEWWVDANRDLLTRLERGEQVGPVGQTQISRSPGSQAL